MLTLLMAFTSCSILFSSAEIISSLFCASAPSALLHCLQQPEVGTAKKMRQATVNMIKAGWNKTAATAAKPWRCCFGRQHTSD
jgi:hypothetical protein